MELKLILNDKTFYTVAPEELAKYAELYPAVNVETELKAMIGWCDSNVKNRKTRGGIKSFITRWLKKAQDRGGSSPLAQPRRSNSVRDMTAQQMLTDISWVPNEQKASMRAYMLDKYGEVYEG